MVASALVLIFIETKQHCQENHSVIIYCEKKQHTFVSKYGAPIGTVSSIWIFSYAFAVSVLIILFIILAY